MYELTIDDIRERRKKLEREVREAIESFRRDTGVSVKGVDITMVDHGQMDGGSATSVANVEAKLKL